MGRMDSALLRGAGPRGGQVPASASNTERMATAPCPGAPPAHGEEKECATSIPPTKWPALLKAATTTAVHVGFAGGMVIRRKRRSALLQAAATSVKLVGSARNTAPMGSALSAVAPLPPNRKRKGRAASMVVAARKCARREAAPRLPEHAASVPSMVRLDRASLMPALPTHAVLVLRFAENTVVKSSTPDAGPSTDDSDQGTQ